MRLVRLTKHRLAGLQFLLPRLEVSGQLGLELIDVPFDGRIRQVGAPGEHGDHGGSDGRREKSVGAQAAVPFGAHLGHFIRH